MSNGKSLQPVRHPDYGLVVSRCEELLIRVNGDQQICVVAPDSFFQRPFNKLTRQMQDEWVRNLFINVPALHVVRGNRMAALSHGSRGTMLGIKPGELASVPVPKTLEQIEGSSILMYNLTIDILEVVLAYRSWGTLMRGRFDGLARLIEGLGGPFNVPEHQWRRITETKSIPTTIGIISDSDFAALLKHEQEIIRNSRLPRVQNAIGDKSQGPYGARIQYENAKRFEYAKTKAKLLHDLRKIPGVWLVDAHPDDPIGSEIELLVDSSKSVQREVHTIVNEVSRYSPYERVVNRRPIAWAKQREGRVIDLGRLNVRITFSKGSVGLAELVQEGLLSSNGRILGESIAIAERFDSQELDIGATFPRCPTELAELIQMGAARSILASSLGGFDGARLGK